MESGLRCFSEHSKKQVQEQTAFDILRDVAGQLRGGRTLD